MAVVVVVVIAVLGMMSFCIHVVLDEGEMRYYYKARFASCFLVSCGFFPSDCEHNEVDLQQLACLQPQPFDVP